MSSTQHAVRGSCLKDEYFILFILKSAYREFEERLGRVQSPKGKKTGLILHAIEKAIGEFSVSDIQNQCPDVSMDMIRRVLKKLRAEKRVECLTRGQNAKWRKTKIWKLGNTE